MTPTGKRGIVYTTVSNIIFALLFVIVSIAAPLSVDIASGATIYFIVSCFALFIIITEVEA